MYVICKGKFLEVKCFVNCTDLLLPLKANFSYFEIPIFTYVIKIGILIRNPNPQCKKYAIESGIRIRRFFGRIAIPELILLTNVFSFFL